MNNMKNYLAAVGLLLLLGACSPRLSPFTEGLYNENRWTEVDLRKIQFYLSEDIVLRRQLSSTDARIEGGRIRVVGGRQVEEIVIRRGTPGVFLFSPKRDRLAISFETGSKDRFLMFGPNPKTNGRYVLLASDWDRRRGLVTYDGRRYEVDTASAWTGLMVDLKRATTSNVRSRVAGGRKVN